MLAAAYADNAIIPPPDNGDAGYHTRSLRVVVDSALRDLERWPSPSSFTVDLSEPLLDVMCVRVMDAFLPPRGPRNVREGRNTLNVEEVRADGSRTVRSAIVPPGSYEGEAMAAALRAALRECCHATEVSAAWDIARGHVVARTGMTDDAGALVAIRVLSPAEPDAYRRSLARSLGLARGDASLAGQALVASGVSLTEIAPGRFQPSGAWSLPDAGMHVVAFPGSGAIVRGVVDRGCMWAPASAGAGDLAGANVWASDVRPDHRAPVERAMPVLHINGFRRVDSPHDEYNACFTILREGAQATLDAPAKHFNPPIHMINRLSVRLTDALGDPYDLQNDDVAFELEITRMMPGAKASGAQFMVG